MYLAQLPKLCSTATVRPVVPTVAIVPLARLRRRVCKFEPEQADGLRQI